MTFVGCCPKCRSDASGARATSMKEANKLAKSHQGIERPRGEEQPKDKPRAQTASNTTPENSASHEATRDPKGNDAPTRSGSSSSRE